MEHVKCAFCKERHPIGAENCPLLTSPTEKPKREPVTKVKAESVTKVEPVTKVPKEPVTKVKAESVTKVEPVTKVPKEPVTKVKAVTKMGRPKIHLSNAEKQRAYRKRRTSQ
jgi:hypothetical protein